MTLFRFLFRELKTHKIAFCTRVSVFFFYFCDFNVLYNPRKIMLIVKCGWLLAGSLCQGLRNRCKKCPVAQYLKSAFPPGVPARNQHWNESNLFLSCKWRRPCPRFTAPCQNLGVPAPKWMSCKWGLSYLTWSEFSGYLSTELIQLDYCTVENAACYYHISGAPNENIVQNHLKIAFLNVF